MSNKSTIKLGSLLKARRLATGLSQVQVATSAQLSLKFLAQVEQGAGRLTLDDLVKLGKVLKYSLTDLFKDAGL